MSSGNLTAPHLDSGASAKLQVPGRIRTYREIPSIRASLIRSIDTNVDRIGHAFEELGDVVRLRGLGFRAICFRNPDDVKQIYREQIHKSGMVFTRVRRAMGNGVFAHPGGEDWKSRRKAVSKAFARSANPVLLPPLVDCLDKLEDRLGTAASSGSPVNLQHALSSLVADYAFQAYFSTTLGERASRASDAFHHVFAGFLDPMPLWLPTRANLRFKKQTAVLRSLMQETVADRLRRHGTEQDVLSVLLEHTSPEDAADQMFSIFSGTCVMIGSLTWMLYLMAKSPEATRQLVSDITLGVGSTVVRLDDMPRIPYARMIFDETVRLYPAAWMTPRVCQTDCHVHGYRVPAQSFLFPMVYFVHRHPDYWQSPDEFNPGRFSQAYATEAFLPFGSGSRMCPGASLAPLIAEYILARIYQRYRLHLTPSTPSDVRPTFGFELSPSEPVHINVEPV